MGGGRGHPNRDRNASGGRLRPTNDAAPSSSVLALRAVRGEHVPPGGYTSRDVPRLRGACGPPWRFVTDNDRSPRQMPAVFPRMQACQGPLPTPAGPVIETSSLLIETS